MDIDGLKTADMVDSIGRLHRHHCHILDLVSPTPDRVLFGPAVTVSYHPTCTAALDPERYNFENLFYEAVGDDPAGRVLVLASNGYTDISVGGGTKMSRVEENGCAGVLTDARPARLRGARPLRVRRLLLRRGDALGRRAGHPVPGKRPGVVSKVGVIPGDCVFADSSGAVVIPEGDVAKVLEGAHRIVAEDGRSRERIATERRPQGRPRPTRPAP